MNCKVRLYLKAGARLVWVVYPEERVIDVYRPGGPLLTLEREEDVLDGGDVLPGFAVAIRDVFKPLSE